MANATINFEQDTWLVTIHKGDKGAVNSDALAVRYAATRKDIAEWVFGKYAMVDACYFPVSYLNANDGEVIERQPLCWMCDSRGRKQPAVAASNYTLCGKHTRDTRREFRQRSFAIPKLAHVAQYLGEQRLPAMDAWLNEAGDQALADAGLAWLNALDDAKQIVVEISEGFGDF